MNLVFKILLYIYYNTFPDVSDPPTVECNSHMNAALGTPEIRMSCTGRMKPAPQTVVWSWGEYGQIEANLDGTEFAQEGFSTGFEARDRPLGSFYNKMQ